jgi:transposase-like protein
MELDAITAAEPAEPESARSPRIELITRGERRRRWTVEQKHTIAAQSLAPGASPTEVARQYGISSGQLYTWRHALLADGTAVRMDAHVDELALRRVLAVLRG